ncbi:membrane-bound lytic murein transglycosylase MltF [Haliea sp. E17]|uniref:membrane-bound lytic murein transglycosylase MltF n=1 Tax=Haliea sp. E17 TaxID=3401576 RepID=UPI003AAE146B
MHTRILTLVALLAVAVSGCARRDSLDQILERGELRVVSRNSPTTWYTDKSGATGFEYALASEFAASLGVELVMVPAYSIPDIFQRLDRDDADLAAAGLSLADHRAVHFPHSVSYAADQPQVVYVSGTFRPRKAEAMTGMSLVTLAGAVNNQYLETLRAEQIPELQWREVNAPDAMELLDMVNFGKAQLAAVNASEFNVQKGLYPRLKVAFDLGPPSELVWYLQPRGDQQRLQQRIDEFLTARLEAGEISALRKQEFSQGQNVASISSRRFSRKMRDTLPDYQELIRKVAAEYMMDWTLLAAIAYQESHWDPHAESPTGVRGMMMLTAPTAEELGVRDRLDAAESLRGGARYLNILKRRLPARIREPDRTFLALAAYNIGRAHLEDARVLTQRQGGNPDLWNDVMLRLPLLESSKYYNDLKYGYARGQEAATYVRNIRHYRSILEWQDIASNRLVPPVQVSEYLPEVLRGTALRSL